MHEEVRSNPYTRLIGSLRLSSFAGRGLPERMRSTAFAFLGLTAAAGLTLVAIFAQLNFPLLNPTPLPSEPSEGGSVGRAVAIERGPQAAEPSQGGLSVVGPRSSVAGSRAGESTPVGTDSDPAGQVGSPSPVATPPVKEDGAPSEPVVTPPASTPPSSPASAENSVPTTEPDPAPSPSGSSEGKAKPARSKPGKTVAKPSKAVAKPAKTSPGKSRSAKPAKAGAKPVPAPVTAAPESKPESAPPSPPAKDASDDKDPGGKALGHKK